MLIREHWPFIIVCCNWKTPRSSLLLGHINALFSIRCSPEEFTQMLCVSCPRLGSVCHIHSLCKLLSSQTPAFCSQNYCSGWVWSKLNEAKSLWLKKVKTWPGNFNNAWNYQILGNVEPFLGMSMIRLELWKLQAPTFRDDSPLAIRDTSPSLVTWDLLRFQGSLGWE